MIKKLFLAFLVFTSTFFFSSDQVMAASCQSFGINMVENIGGPFEANDPNNKIVVRLSGVASNEDFRLHFRGELLAGGIGSTYINSVTTTEGEAYSIVIDPDVFLPSEEWVIRFQGGGLDEWCDVGTYEVIGAKCESVEVFQSRSGVPGGVCFGGGTGCLNTSSDIEIKSKIVYGYNNENFTGTIIHDLRPGGSKQDGTGSNGIAETNHGTLDPGSYEVIVRQDATISSNPELCRMSFNISVSCEDNENSCQEDPSGDTTPDTTNSSGPKQFSLCDQIPDGQADQKSACLACTGGEGGKNGVWTAIGCINKEPQEIIQSFIRLGLGIGGGVALLTFMAAGFIYTTSQGSPERVKNAKEMMTASIVGILFVLFSVTILQFIGFSILKIPGFGG